MDSNLLKTFSRKLLPFWSFIDVYARNIIIDIRKVSEMMFCKKCVVFFHKDELQKCNRCSGFLTPGGL